MFTKVVRHVLSHAVVLQHDSPGRCERRPGAAATAGGAAPCSCQRSRGPSRPAGRSRPTGSAWTCTWAVHLLGGRRQGEQEGEQLADKLLALGVLLELGVVLQYGAHQVQHA